MTGVENLFIYWPETHNWDWGGGEGGATSANISIREATGVHITGVLGQGPL